MSSPVRFKAVVPARYASTRLPAKPLLDLGGKPMVVRVAERALLSGAEEVWVATDHADVFQAAEAHGLSVLLTRTDHPTGTDRLAEVVERCGWSDDTIVVNVQVVCKADGDAMYFSRALIPFARDHFAAQKDTLPSGLPALRHIGMYAYRAGFLRAYARLAPSPLESFEALEQLRALWHGYRINVWVSDHMPVPGVDTPEDAASMQAWFAKNA